MDDFKAAETGDNAAMGNRDPRTKTMTKNLRIREDTAKYLLNLDVDSAHYDPKSRSMRENPNPFLPSDKQLFKGDNFVRMTGDTVGFLEQERLAWEAVETHNSEVF